LIFNQFIVQNSTFIIHHSSFKIGTTMIHENVRVCDTPAQTAEAVARYMAALIEPGKPFYVAVSGGETVLPLFDYWAGETKSEAYWPNVRLFWVDERCVPLDNPESNFGVARQRLLVPLGIPEANVHRIHGEAGAYDESIRYENEIRKRVPFSLQLPQFDLIVLGMGADGHTASLFPQHLDQLDSDRVCLFAQHPKSQQLRVTLSMKVINNARHVAFFVTGEDKAERLEEILNGKPEADRYPAAYVEPHSGNLHWFLDEAAASAWQKNKVLSQSK
jgi:6-phosphogluconolactonase